MTTRTLRLPFLVLTMRPILDSTMLCPKKFSASFIVLNLKTNSSPWIRLSSSAASWDSSTPE